MSICELIFFHDERDLKRFSQASSKLVATKAETKFDEKYINISVGLDLLPNDAYAVSFKAQLHVELEDFLVQIGIALPTANGKYEALIKNSVSDVCKYYKNNSGNMFLQLFFHGHFGSKSFPTTCPVKPGSYYMEDFQLNEDLLKIRTVETKFLVLVDICTKLNGKLKCFVNMKFYGEVKDKKKWEKEMALKNNTGTV